MMYLAIDGRRLTVHDGWLVGRAAGKVSALDNMLMIECFTLAEHWL